MIDEPNAEQLLAAMAQTLAETVVPACEGAPQHAARVVANLCRILARESAAGAAGQDATIADLQTLLDSAETDLARLAAQLDAQLLSGERSTDEQTFRVLHASTARRLAIAKPKYA